MVKWVWAVALGSATLAAGAAAQEGPAPRGGGMQRADTNGDGKISRAEYQAQVDSRFARLDVNGDGLLGNDEMPMRGMGRRSMTTDVPPPRVNNTPPAPPSGPISRDQFRTLSMSRFDRIDANHDGNIDADEMAAARPYRGSDDRSAPPPPPVNGAKQP
jgi:hypothetical protein